MDSIGEEVAKVLFSAVARAAVERIAKGLRAKDSTVDPELVLERLKLEAQRIMAVKTLLSPETHVSIQDFYCAPSVKQGQRRFAPRDSRDFRDDHVLIEGVAGQGKSTLLRYLCAHSIVEHGRLAMYFELRHLTEPKPLVSVVQESLRNFGLPAKEEALRTLAAQRDIEVYLDGFDELSQKDQMRIDRDVTFLATHFPLIKVFVSARPHAGLAQNHLLSSYKIEKLGQQDAFRMIDKLCESKPTVASDLKAKLIEHKGDATRLLETPLLVTLLVAKYRETNQIPEQLSEFYASIFQTLFERHDSFKAPFKRTKTLKLTAHGYEQLFGQFCFGSLFAEQLTTELATQLAAWALQAKFIDGRGEDLLQDIANISSLITEETRVWSFIHASVQEFYAASHLLSDTDEELQKNASKLVGVANASTRDQVFRFAQELNEFRSLTFIQLPFFTELLAPLDDASELSPDDCWRWLAAHTREIVVDNNRDPKGHFFTIYTDIVDERVIRLYALNEYWPDVLRAIELREPAESLQELKKIKPAALLVLAQTKKRLAPAVETLRATRDEVKKRSSERRAHRDMLGELISASRAPGSK